MQLFKRVYLLTVKFEEELNHVNDGNGFSLKQINTVSR